MIKLRGWSFLPILGIYESEERKKSKQEIIDDLLERLNKLNAKAEYIEKEFKKKKETSQQKLKKLKTIKEDINRAFTKGIPTFRKCIGLSGWEPLYKEFLDDIADRNRILDSLGVNTSGVKVKNNFEKIIEEDKDLKKYFDNQIKELGIRIPGQKGSFENERRAFNSAVTELSNYPGYINFLIKDKGYSKSSKEVKHLIECEEKGKKIIEEYKDFFKGNSNDIQKAKKIVDEINEVSWELYDEGFYEDQLDEYEEKYGKLN